MKFSQLPAHIQRAITNNQFDIDDLNELTKDQIQYLDDLPEETLFTAWCTWHGFLGWSGSIRNTYENIFAPDQLVIDTLKRIANMSRGSYDHDTDEMISDAITWAQTAVKKVRHL